MSIQQHFIYVGQFEKLKKKDILAKLFPLNNPDDFVTFKHRRTHDKVVLTDWLRAWWIHQNFCLNVLQNTCITTTSWKWKQCIYRTSFRRFHRQFSLQGVQCFYYIHQRKITALNNRALNLNVIWANKPKVGWRHGDYNSMATGLNPISW